MQPDKSVVRREWWAGGAMVVLGLGALLQAMTYELGTLARMGPGMFPAILGVVLILLGALIAKMGKSPLNAEDEHEPESPPDWRGWGCIVGGLLAFILVGKYGGLVPATLILVFVSALGDRAQTLRGAAILSVAVTLLGVLVFSWGLQLQFPLFRWG
ncbi:hypothetical protein CEG14_21640 [Bordetella genomosp. 1]|uniref:DUF1468 domain-containing protein n=1 Tax=Bordetella genomosp. 1 TaxID=1395607 RepID=A0A261RVY3_9BORD|nr:tripartite tricarboxylate transporter TctB family protein [Bordetella genomosp. 1]MDQ8035730.1 tripartite tricarboxylate transporter TctB family protein [Bordetella sp.]OZI29228.1 hypothetical protein CEG14_21640 [Bordetella genomosp. 1]OZI65038.1 hypothetical protein CAL27_08155 [Bordetella genomosp. 1]